MKFLHEIAGDATHRSRKCSLVQQSSEELAVESVGGHFLLGEAGAPGEKCAGADSRRSLAARVSLSEDGLVLR